MDDDRTVGNVLLKVLGAEHEVIVLSSARDALARLPSGEHFDVILCDLMMPEMTGMDSLCRATQAGDGAGRPYDIPHWGCVQSDGT